MARLEDMSGRVRKNYEKKHKGDGLAIQLKEFQDLAASVHKAFKRATGTGFLGSIRRAFHAKDSQREVKKEEFRAKVESLIRCGKEVDRLMKNYRATEIQSDWGEIRKDLKQLAKLK